MRAWNLAALLHQASTVLAREIEKVMMWQVMAYAALHHQAINRRDSIISSKKQITALVLLH